MSNTTSGNCLCGNIAYEYSGEPTLQALCYCGPCRKVSGGTNTVNWAVPEDKFTLVKGKPRSFSTEHEFGMTLTLFFCTGCGNTLWKESTYEGLKGLKLIKAGTLSDAAKLNSKINAEFYAPEKASWLGHVFGADQRKDF